MCGIVAVFRKGNKWDQVEASVKRIASAIKHRGPDGQGHHITRDWGFANLRLAIVDVVGGDQPIFNDEGSVGIVYNGEIYNHKDLRKDLENAGYSFHTNSDTEVALRAYEAYGTDAFKKFNGMFAFCIWDDRKKEAYLVRDQIGIKPLYIYEDDEKIICSSELKGVLSISDLELDFNPIGVQDYLLYRYVQAPYTLFRNIHSLEAGTYIRIRDGKIEHYRYWDVEYKEAFSTIGVEDAQRGLHERFLSAVERQLMGEVPIGILLSGGVDSSAIAYYVREAGANLTTFNIGFPEVNEFKYSRVVAKSLGLRHVEVLMTVDELLGQFDQVVLALDHPMADPACLPLYRLSQELKRHVTVVLSGEGGDELFAGYPQYQQMMLKPIPYNQRFQSFLEKSWYFLNYREFIGKDMIPPVEFRHWKYFDENSLLNGMLAYDMKTWMPENLMMKADKIMMSHSLEGRFPFLDLELFEYAASLPAKYKLRDDGSGKWILKELLKEVLPSDIIGRPKMGFTVPVDILLEQMKSKVMDTITQAKKSNIANVVDINRVLTLAKQHYAGYSANALQLWSIFVLLYWVQTAIPQYKSGVVLPSRDS
jgi:asparagine synthase (glutamine-hydrolysing)